MDPDEVDKDHAYPSVDAKTYAVPANEHADSHPSLSAQLKHEESLSNTPVARTIGDAPSYETHIGAPAQQEQTSRSSYGATTSNTAHFHADETDIPTDMTFGHPIGNTTGSKAQTQALVDEQEAPSITNEIATTDSISSRTAEKQVNIDIPHARDLQDHADLQDTQDAHPTTTIIENESISKGKGIDFSTSEEVETATGARPNDVEDAQESTQPHPNIEVDSNPRYDSDADSAIGSMPASSTVSLRESVFNYIEENGRTYHAFQAGKYLLPNDETEQERLDLQHNLFIITMDNKLHLAPLKNPQNVLDIATGTGIWAIEFGILPHSEEYPSASVLGTDLSPIQPAYVPPNCRFEIHDAEEDWIFSQPFDYIHARAIVVCFRDPQSVIASIYENLAPGGWFEFQDPIMPLKSIDGTLKGTALDDFQNSCMEAGAQLGRAWTNGKNYGRWMREAGFEDVQERSYYWATNQWVKGRQQKLQARWLQANLQEILPAWGLGPLSRAFGWSRERIEVAIAHARADLSNPNIHAYAECYVAYGRKPGGPSN